MRYVESYESSDVWRVGLWIRKGCLAAAVRARAIQKTVGHGRDLWLSWRVFVALSARPIQRAAPAQLLLLF